MNRTEAIKSMLDGNKITYGKRDCNYYIYFDNMFRIKYNNLNDAEEYDVNLIIDDGWEIYEEPKQKVKLYKWIVKDSNVIRETDYFKDENLMKCNQRFNVIVIKRLDDSMIEIEE